MHNAPKLKLYGAVVNSDGAGRNFALILAATADEAFTQVRELAPKRASVEIIPAEEMLWDQYRGFAVLTTNSLYENYPPDEDENEDEHPSNTIEQCQMLTGLRVPAPDAH